MIPGEMWQKMGCGKHVETVLIDTSSDTQYTNYIFSSSMFSTTSTTPTHATTPLSPTLSQITSLSLLLIISSSSLALTSSRTSSFKTSSAPSSSCFTSA
ncbi:unnamed protein product [Periconia digitata]|uniref:Uncharacterized protein n=1 Tax=Periconia digitata TaxID=1303443 RepID=A0A9W4UDJ5_9PLEO|nr:unnamed protein product [Periconia digitata]